MAHQSGEIYFKFRAMILTFHLIGFEPAAGTGVYEYVVGFVKL